MDFMNTLKKMFGLGADEDQATGTTQPAAIDPLATGAVPTKPGLQGMGGAGLGDEFMSAPKLGGGDGDFIKVLMKLFGG